MKNMKTIWKLVLLLSLLLALTACGSDVAAELQDATPTQVDPAAIFTSAASTVAAQLTQTAAAFSPTPPPPTETLIPQPTATLINLDAPTAISTLDPTLPTLTPLAGGIPTVIPTATTVALSTQSGPICDEMTYGSPVDINYPDGSAVPARTDFEKIWRVYNSGVCTWDEGYMLIPVSSTSTRSGDNNPLDAANPAYKFGGNDNPSVPPGGTVDVGAHLTAPKDNGEYTTCFILVNDRGVYFGGVLCADIKVTDGD